ncbi:MAG TPA: DUF1415 domain-containing protein [Chromatiaceae bacterium]|nr:DUF1415 domain-containing protein [Chromatiaceae bacterium]
MKDPVEQTRCWVKEVVIGLNLCPFAKTTFEAGTIRYQTCNAAAGDAVYAELIEELAVFALLSPEEAETGLFIISTGLMDFGDYLDVLEDAQAALEEAGLDDMLQLASFHPDYCFEGLEDDDPANYTNRSPYPMFHLIRQDGLAAALETWPEPESIPERNVALLREMGLSGVQELLRNCRQKQV